MIYYLTEQWFDPFLPLKYGQFFVESGLFVCLTTCNIYMLFCLLALFTPVMVNLICLKKSFEIKFWKRYQVNTYFAPCIYLWISGQQKTAVSQPVALWPLSLSVLLTTLTTNQPGSLCIHRLSHSQLKIHVICFAYSKVLE